MNNKELYQEIYDNNSWYGNSKDKSGCRCPGVAFLKHYKEYIESPIVDLGCGRGDTVTELRKLNHEVYGYDIISLDNDMYIADITKNIDLSFAKTIICMDVIEHIEEKDLNGLFENLRQSEKQVISIHNGPNILGSKDLHVTKKPFHIWSKFIEDRGFKIQKTVKATHQQMIYFTVSI